VEEPEPSYCRFLVIFWFLRFTAVIMIVMAHGFAMT